MSSQLYNLAHTLYATNNQKVVYNFNTLNNDTGAVISLYGCTLYFTAKANKSDVANVAAVNTGVLNTTNGLGTIIIPKATMDTVSAGEYFYELSLENQLGEITTLTTSKWIVSQKI
jgi:hypothetical protein